ncbi:MAG: sterol desaturase family protein [Cyclobacteriaceae bacterium]|nr:sterol desaturase family protein [Cyclobacteriaceae bacterium]
MDLLYHTQLFFSIFFLLLFGYYFIPAGTAYGYFYLYKKSQPNNRHIQPRYPTRQSMMREIKWSVLSVLIMSFFVQGLYLLIINGYTRMYFSISDYGWLYFGLSTVISILAYDTYFYWLHRFMHLKAVFPILHRTHHLSHTPSPWAILAFDPLESILEFGIYPILVFLVPLHPVALGLFVAHNIILNTAGHIGFEVVPKSFFRHPILQFGLTVTHHDMHHSKTNCNYGIYFNFWDRLMKTNHPDYEKTFFREETEAPQP